MKSNREFEVRFERISLAREGILGDEREKDDDLQWKSRGMDGKTVWLIYGISDVGCN